MFVEITNYKTIKHTKFEFEGYATILGKNFIGKSATLQAINAALTNKSGMKFIRWGEKFCEIRIIHGDLDLLWHKEASNNFYLINGVEYNKINKELPEPLKQLGYAPLEVGKEKVNLLFSQQFNPLFLVDRSDTTFVTDLLAAVHKMDVAYKAGDLCKNDHKRASSLLKLRIGDKSAAEEELKVYEDFGGIQECFSKSQVTYREIQESQDTLRELEQLQSSIKVVANECRQLNPVNTIVVPKDSDLAKLSKDVEELGLLAAEYRQSSREVDGLKGLYTVGDPSEREILTTQKELYELTILAKEYREISDKVTRLKGLTDMAIPSLEGIDDMVKDIQEVGALRKEYDLINTSVDRLSVLDTLAIPEVTLDLDEVGILEAIVIEKNLAVTEVQKVKRDLAAVVLSINEADEGLKEYPNCPTCGSEVCETHND